MCMLGCAVGKQISREKVAWKVFRRTRKSTGRIVYRSLYKHTYIAYERGVWYTAVHENHVPTKKLTPGGEAGFWSFKTREQARTYRYTNMNNCGAVVCKVLIDGDTVLHMDGYRSTGMCIIKTGQ